MTDSQFRESAGDLIRVLVVDDEQLTRTLISYQLQMSGFDVQCFGDPRSAIAWSTHNRVDVACLDVDLRASMSGLDVANVLKAMDPAPAVVFLTVVADPKFFDPDFNPLVGGMSYLLKSGVDRGSLVEAVHAAHSGMIFADPRLLASNVGAELGLSKQQVSILRLCARAQTNAQIAELTGISVSAVETSLNRAAAKLGVVAKPGVNMRVACVSAYISAVMRA